jgi:large subunit ribosomal protein L31e
MTEERIYTIPLRRAKRVPRHKRSKRAISEVRRFIERHLKADEVKLDPSVSEKVWERGAEKPPSRIRVRATLDIIDDVRVAEVKLAEE